MRERIKNLLGKAAAKARYLSSFLLCAAMRLRTTDWGRHDQTPRDPGPPRLGTRLRNAVSPENFDTFDDYANSVNLIYGLFCSAFVAVMMYVFGWSDERMLAPWPEKVQALQLWKFASAVYFTGLFLYLSCVVRSYKRLRPWHVIALPSISIFLNAVFVSRVGPLSEPWLYPMYAAPAVTVLLVMHLRQRILLGICMFLSVLTGIAILHFEYFSFDFFYTYVIVLGAINCISIGMGTVFTYVMEQNFNRAAEQAVTHRELEQRVAERTAVATKALQDLVRNREDIMKELARELHDELGHLISTHGLTAEKVLQVIESPAESRDLVRAFREEIREIELAVRQVVTQYRKDIYEQGNVRQIVESRLEGFLDLTGMEVDVFIEPADLALPALQSRVLSRFLQEALTNTRKHAQAQNVEVTIIQENGVVTATIWDDGRGFDVDEKTSRYGLKGMRERAAILNGTIEIASQPGSGTAVTLIFPLNTPRET